MLSGSGIKKKKKTLFVLIPTLLQEGQNAFQERLWSSQFYYNIYLDRVCFLQ